MLQCRGARDAVFIRSDHISEQLLEMKDILALSESDRAERCVACNGKLYEVSDRAEVQDLVPDYVYHNFESFMRCKDCGKVYWEGSHYKKISGRISEILRKGNED